MPRHRMQRNSDESKIHEASRRSLYYSSNDYLAECTPRNGPGRFGSGSGFATSVPNRPGTKPVPVRFGSVWVLFGSDPKVKRYKNS